MIENRWKGLEREAFGEHECKTFRFPNVQDADSGVREYDGMCAAECDVTTILLCYLDKGHPGPHLDDADGVWWISRDATEALEAKPVMPDAGHVAWRRPDGSWKTNDEVRVEAAVLRGDMSADEARTLLARAMEKGR